MSTRIILGCFVSFLFAGGAHAQSADFKLNPESAERIIAGCKKHSKSKYQSHAMAVHDKGGFLVAAFRMRGNNPGTMAFAQSKAKAVGIWRFSTAQMANGTVNFPGFGNAPHIVTVPGGVPFYTSDGKIFLGAVGVSGEAPKEDVKCAVAGSEAAVCAQKENEAKAETATKNNNCSHCSVTVSKNHNLYLRSVSCTCSQNCP